MAVNTITPPPITDEFLDKARPVLQLARALGLTVERRRRGRTRNSTGQLGWRVHAGRAYFDEIWIYFWGESQIRVRLWRADFVGTTIISLPEALVEMRRIAEQAGRPERTQR